MKVVVVCVSLLLAACATTHTGRDFRVETINGFETGVTTKEDVFEAIGRPWNQRVDFFGNETWTYLYTASRVGKIPILFDSDMVMRKRTKRAILIFHKGVLVEIMMTLPK